jgi:F-type H+-transporting ATPase subunit b
MLNVDVSLFVQIANFLFLVFMLNAILYRPIRQIISKRNSQFQSLGADISKYAELAKEKDRQIQETLASARKEGALAKEGLKREASAEEEKILRETNLAIQERLKKTREEIELGILKAKEGLETQVAQYGQELAQKLLGRAVMEGRNG